MNGALIRATAARPYWRLAAAAVLVAATAAVASAQYCTPDECDECNLHNCHLNCCNEPPELWVINTRCAPKCSNLDEGFNCITFERWDAKCCRFVHETCESFLAQEASMPTLFFIHGNTLKHKGAMKEAWEVYQRMRCCPGKKRLVLWSWPAQIAFKRPIITPRKLIMKNLRIKYVYAEYQAYYLAKLVQRMSLSQRVMLAGHSYGAITAAGCLHLLGGGCIRGLTLEGGAPVERPNLRATMLSGAFDNDMLNLDGRYGLAFVVAEKILVTRNCTDKTLHNWPKVSLRGRKALGVTGINGNVLGEYRHKLCQLTTTADVGNSHYLAPHLASGHFMSALCCVSFSQCLDCLKNGAPGPKVGQSFKEAIEPAPAAMLEEKDAPAAKVLNVKSAGVDDNSADDEAVDSADAGDASSDEAAATDDTSDMDAAA